MKYMFHDIGKMSFLHTLVYAFSAIRIFAKISSNQPVFCPVLESASCLHSG